MRTRPVWLICLLAGLAASRPWAAPPPPAATDAVRRFALVIGANHGSRDRVELHYAVSDARALMTVFNKIGGIFPMDSLLVIDPGRQSFLSSLNLMQEKIIKAKISSKKIELIFYYSGHSDEESILLNDEKISYREIRTWIDHLPADVRIAILDSCSSGAFTRFKGGSTKAPFLADTAYDMKGYAFMTSSSSDEASQESDRLRSSIFTHNLMAGLRGAADLNHDGRITLNEAYQFAYNETLAKTEKTLYGSQHPNYNIQMTGTGDVVMTDIRNSSAILTFDQAIQGRVFIRNTNGQLMLELHKTAGEPVQIGLEEGDYSVLTEEDGKILESRQHLEFGQNAVVTYSQFARVEREHTVRRGKSPKDETEDDSEIFKTKRLSFILYPKKEGHEQTVYRHVFSIFGFYARELDGTSVGLGPGTVDEDAVGFMGSLTGNYVGGNLYGFQVGNFYNYVGQDMKGIQLSDFVNVSGYLRGAQFSLVNITGDCDGLQCGLVNIAKKQNGASLGLVNLAENGKIDVPVWVDNLTGLNTGMRFRVNYFYSMLAFGGDPGRTRVMDQPLAVSLYLGGHIPLNPFYLETDFGFRILDPVSNPGPTNNHAVVWRTLAGWSPVPYLSLFGGTGVAFSYDVDKKEDRVLHSQLQPVLLGGIQFIF